MILNLDYNLKDYCFRNTISINYFIKKKRNSKVKFSMIIETY